MVDDKHHVQVKKWVLWCDLLGFKNWLERNSSQIDVAVNALDEALKYAFQKDKQLASGFESLQISDTIVISTSSDTPEEFVLLSGLSSVLMAECVDIDLPLRGVISHGEFISQIAETRVSVFGETVVEAATIEPSLDIFGVVVAPSCVEYWGVEGLTSEFDFYGSPMRLRDYLTPRNIPTKNGDFPFITVPWMFRRVPSSYMDMCLRILSKPQNYTFDDLKAFNKKIKNSIIMLDSIPCSENEKDELYKTWDAMVLKTDEAIKYVLSTNE